MNLSGKEYFTPKEAAEFCCVSYSHFRAKIKDTDLNPICLWGKKLYRRVDLKKLIEDTAWQQSNGASTSANQAPSRRRPTSIGARAAGNAA